MNNLQGKKEIKLPSTMYKGQLAAYFSIHRRTLKTKLEAQEDYKGSCVEKSYISRSKIFYRLELDWIFERLGVPESLEKLVEKHL